MHKYNIFFYTRERGQLKCKMRLAKDIIGVDKLSCTQYRDGYTYVVRKFNQIYIQRVMCSKIIGAAFYLLLQFFNNSFEGGFILCFSFFVSCVTYHIL